MEVVKGPDNSKQAKLTRLIGLYENELRRMCCVYLGNVTMAEDAVQETFLKAYHRMDEFRGDSSEKTWLMRIAINVCKDIRRSGWFRMIDHAVDLERLQMPAVSSHGEYMELTAAILKLPRKYREVVWLYFYEGFKMEEIAHMLHISASSVSRRIEKAKSLLKNLLEGGTEDE